MPTSGARAAVNAGPLAEGALEPLGTLVAVLQNSGEVLAASRTDRGAVGSWLAACVSLAEEGSWGLLALP